jgi:Ca2+-binding EF-hand superfamily protein
MKTTLKIAIAAAALIAIGALGTAAYAHKQGRGHGGGYHMGGHGMGHGGMGRRGGMGRHGMRYRMKHMMTRYDADKDGKITQAEINSNREAWLKEFDANNDGQLSLDEFRQLWLKARAQRIVRAFQRFDADGSAGVTLEEYQEPMANLVERRDRNGDGALSREDRKRHGKKWRRRMMQDNDDGRMNSETNETEKAPAEGGSAN